METTEDHDGTQLNEELLTCHDKSRNSGFECLSQPNGPLPSEPASDSVLDSHDGHLKELFPIDKCENDLSVKCEAGGTSSLSNRTGRVRFAKDLLLKAANNQAVPEIDKPRSLIFSDEPSEISGEPHHKQDPKNMPDIKELIDFIGEPNFRKSSSISSRNNKGFIKKNAINGNLRKSDNNDTVNSRDFQDGTSNRIEDEETSNLEFKPTDFMDAKASSKVSVPTRNKDQRQPKVARSSRKAEENRGVCSYAQINITEFFARFMLK
ncbi:hypothetical protein OROMI_034512 [Orobanche minor]